MEASDKQIKFLISNGFNLNEIMELDKKEISEAIKTIYEKKGWKTKDGDDKPEVKETIHVASGTITMSKPNAYPKDPVGLAVEVFCAIIGKEEDLPRITVDIGSNTMDKAIKLVKQAQEAFS